MEARWHADPTGRHELRYWDGQQWTSHVSDGGRQSTDPPTMSSPAQPVYGTPAQPTYGASPPGAGPPPSAPAWNPQPAFAQQPWQNNAREHPKGTTILVLGILGIVVCTILAPIAWAMGNTARKEMARDPSANWTNKGNVTAGWICGIVGTCLLAVTVVVIIIAVAVAGGSST